MGKQVINISLKWSENIIWLHNIYIYIINIK